MSQRLFVLLTALVVGLSWMGGRASAVVVVPAPAQSGWTTITKATDEARTSSGSLADDSTLTFSVAASTKYRIRAKVFFYTNSAADFLWEVTYPATPTYNLMALAECPGQGGGNFNTSTMWNNTSAMSSRALDGAGNPGCVFIDEVLHNVTAGNYKFRWAQNTSNGSATTVLAGSYLEYKVVQ